MAKATTADKSKSAKLDTSKAAKPAKNKSAKPAKSSNKNAEPGVFGRFGAYLRGVRSEMTRVVWPTRQEVINSSLVVIVTLLFFVAFTFLVDQVVIWFLSLINQIGG